MNSEFPGLQREAPLSETDRKRAPRDPRLPLRVYLRNHRYYYVTPGGKWIGLSHERNGYPGVYQALAVHLGATDYKTIIPRPPADARSAKRAAALARQTPRWADIAAIEAVYAEARRRTAEAGIPHHVDHEIPLQGRLVSGLHVETNLRVMVGDANVRKGNQFEPC